MLRYRVLCPKSEKVLFLSLAKQFNYLASTREEPDLDISLCYTIPFCIFLLHLQIKAYPGYNFTVLLLGPESNTQKRLEEVCTVILYSCYFLSFKKLIHDKLSLSYFLLVLGSNTYIFYLNQETGAKIRVYGTKKDIGGKVCGIYK